MYWHPDDPASFWAKLYLYDYESDFISSLVKKLIPLKPSNLRISLTSLIMNAILMILVNFLGVFIGFILINRNLNVNIMGYMPLSLTWMIFTETNFMIREITIHFLFIACQILVVTFLHSFFFWVILSLFLRIAKCTLKFSKFVPKVKQLF